MKSKKVAQKEVKTENKKPPIKVVEQKETTKTDKSKTQKKDDKTKNPPKDEKASKNQPKDEKTSKNQPKEDKTKNQPKEDKTKNQPKDEKASKNQPKNDKTSKKDNKDEKASKNSKASKNVKIEDIEKKMLKGQDHIEPKEELKEKVEDIEKKYEPPQSPIKEVNMKETIVKPRETYLKEKLIKMNCNVNLLSNIQKEMGDKIKNIMTEEGVKVGEKTKDLKQYMVTKDKTKLEIEQYMNKKKYKEMKNLMDELNSLKISLKQAEENEKFLQANKEKALTTSIQEKNNEKMIFDKSQNLMKLREIQAKKEEIQEKIAEINYRIKNSIETDKLQTMPNKERVKDFINNFERDKEIIEIRAKKYFKEYKERNQRKQNDLNQLMEKRKKEIEEKEKEMNDKNEEIRKKFKEKEKDLEKKHTKKNEEIFLKYKPYINQKLETNKKSYLYNKRYDNYMKKEEKYFQKNTEKNKEEKDKYKYKFDEIEKFSQDFAEKIESRKYEQEQKFMELSEKWEENKKKLPQNNNYKSMENLNRKKILEEEKKSQMNKEKMKEYVVNIRESFSPEIDINKRLQLQSIIHALEDPKNAAKKYTLVNQKKKRIIIKKRDTSKPSKFKWELKLDPNPNKEINYIKKPKKINLLPITRTTTEVPNKKPDYLSEIISKKKRNRSNSSKVRENSDNEFVDINKKSEKWETIMNKNDVNILENINNVQNKVEILEQKAEEKEKLLQLKGGVENNPELGKQVSSLIIDSIEAKINMLKKINNA